MEIMDAPMPAPIIRTVPKPTCVLCGAPGETLYAALRDYIFSVPGIWQLKQCTRTECELVWLDPAPLPDDLPQAYRNYYTHTGSTSPSAMIFAAGKRACSAACEVPALFTGLHQERRKFASMLLGGLPPGRLLDVGCGDGHFLHRMAKGGWQGTGIDFDGTAIECGRKKYGLNLEVGDFQTANFGIEGFDAVTMSHVIEHVPDPMACLEKCRQLLRPGGRLVLSTPNVRSLGHKSFKQNWRGLEPPRHLHLFTASLLAVCARRAGLAVVSAGSTAVHADYLANASLAIERAAAEGGTARARMRYAVPAFAFQQREHLALRRDSHLGEEAFLIAERN
jgi:2-polyprenyl-3-methyl-5-hydroxy-6-metoxy-1,4-benzoquinol methylase